MSKSHNNKKTSLLIKATFALLILISGVFILLSIDNKQDIRQQAWIGSNDVESSCAGGDCIKNTLNTSVFTSPQNSYKIDLTNSEWMESEIPKTSSKKNQDPSFFVFRNQFGFATVFLNTVPLKKEYLNVDINVLAEKIESDEINQNDKTRKYLGKEIVKLEGKPIIKYTFQEEIFGIKTVYYEYVILGKELYLEAEVRTTETAVIKNEVNKFFNSIEFSTDTENVKGASTEKEVSLDESKIAELVKPSIANILYVYCKELQFSAGSSSVYIKSSYPFCSGSYGSGFLVNGSGLLATNGHVVVSYPEQDLIGGLNNGDPAIVTFVIDLVREIAVKNGLETTPESGLVLTASLLRDPSTIQALILTIYELFDQNIIKIIPTAEKYFVNLGSEAFEFSSEELTPQNIEGFVIKKDTIFSAEKVGADYANLFSKAVIFDKKAPSGSDVALLKIFNSNAYSYPSLKLGSVESLKEGDGLLILGFPGVVSGSNNEYSLVDYVSSSTKVTVTKGIVSSIKKDFGGNNLIQTDATIGHGNSGGPAFNKNGEVVGIATYGMGDESGNFNFLRDIYDLERLAENESFDVERVGNETYQNWETALGLYWSNHFTKSLSFLSKVETSYPIHPTADIIAESAQQGINEGKDVDLIFGIQKTSFYLIIGGVFTLVILAIVALILKRRKSSNDIFVTPQAPEQQAVQASSPMDMAPEQQAVQASSPMDMAPAVNQEPQAEVLRENDTPSVQ